MRDCFRVKLSRMSGGEALRTSEVEGQCPDLPEVGKRFNMIGQGLEIGFRVITTSPVVEVKEGDDHFILTTETGSIYKLEFLDKAN